MQKTATDPAAQTAAPPDTAPATEPVRDFNPDMPLHAGEASGKPRNFSFDMDKKPGS